MLSTGSNKNTFVLLLDDPTEPDLTIHPPSYLVSVEYNPKDPNILAGGCYNGQVSIHSLSLSLLPNIITNLPISLSYVQICWWDARKGGQPDGMIPMDQCHIDPVYKTIWLNAKAGTEFFTGSTDGMVSNFSYQIGLKKS